MQSYKTVKELHTAQLNLYLTVHKDSFRLLCYAYKYCPGYLDPEQIKVEDKKTLN
ncbi:hypothetical protein D3C81_869230 [compost metagenome]